MDEFNSIWHYPLIRLSSGIEVTVSQILLTLLVVALGFALIKFVQRVLGRQMSKADVDPNVAQTIQRVIFWALLVLLFITALGMLQIPITALAFISGAVAIGVLLVFDRILDMSRTATNVFGDACCCVIVARLQGEELPQLAREESS